MIIPHYVKFIRSNHTQAATKDQKTKRHKQKDKDLEHEQLVEAGKISTSMQMPSVQLLHRLDARWHKMTRRCFAQQHRNKKEFKYILGKFEEAIKVR